ncbi:unnamed protein product [Staurois parvus]|uniref:Uncharacterized protein n=1 Tax=Staurois parvus TaxID=386267 RepID=A0ABN9F165_9NEOB|nr:unnamed protein product [Staurois parvus]
MAVHSTAMQSSVLTVKHMDTAYSKTAQSLPFDRPSLPLVQCQCFFFFFFIELITVLVSLGMSLTPSQFPPVSECPPQSPYKSLISTITSKN